MANENGYNLLSSLIGAFKSLLGTGAAVSDPSREKPLPTASRRTNSTHDAVPITLAQHWAVMKKQGYTATQLMEFIQPIADLEGISVSYVYEDESGRARVYNHKRDDPTFENPMSRAIREKHLSKERALQFALNEEGRIWVESNFIELR